MNYKEVMTEMDHSILKIKTITQAERGREALRSHGYRAYIRRSAVTPETEGCGYSIEVNGSYETARQILTQAGIRVLGRGEP